MRAKAAPGKNLLFVFPRAGPHVRIYTAIDTPRT